MQIGVLVQVLFEVLVTVRAHFCEIDGRVLWGPVRGAVGGARHGRILAKLRAGLGGTQCRGAGAVVRYLRYMLVYVLGDIPFLIVKKGNYHVWEVPP